MKPPLVSWKRWVLLAIFVMQAHTVSAEPAGACQEQASRFATDPGLLNANALVMLSYCASQELANRTGASVTVPAPAAVTPAAARERGKWPEPPPWSTRPWPSYGPDWD
jgi:hypothetical protein